MGSGGKPRLKRLRLWLAQRLLPKTGGYAIYRSVTPEEEKENDWWTGH